MNELAAILKAHNLKATPQRLSIFEILYNTNAHPNAEMIYAVLHASQPTISLATVYKTLDTLVKHGLVQQLNVGEDSFRYDAHTKPHPHIKCTECNKVYDMYNPPGIEEFKENIKKTTRFKLTSEQFYFFGVCPDCQ
jgi:Fur family peroxide stress response transcriptional regulator